MDTHCLVANQSMDVQVFQVSCISIGVGVAIGIGIVLCGGCLYPQIGAFIYLHLKKSIPIPTPTPIFAGGYIE